MKSFQRDGINRGILWTGLEKALVYGVGFVQGVILARLLSPEDFGLTAMLGIFLGLGGALAESGLGTALVVMPVSAAMERAALRWNLGVAAAMYVALALAAPGIARWYGKPILTPLMWVMAAGLMINAASVVATARLTRQGQFGRLAWVNGASSLLGTAAAVVLAVCGFGVWSIVAVGIAHALVRTCLAWTLSRTDVLRPVHETPSGDAGEGNFRALLAYGGKLMASGLIHVIYTESYNLVIGKMWSVASVGLFVRGLRWAKLPGEMINESVGRVALPELTKERRFSGFVRPEGLGRFLFLNVALLWPGLVVFWVFAPQVVGGVLGAQWLECVPYLRILLVGQMMTPIGGLALQAIRASGHAEDVLKTDAWKKPLGLVALCAGIPFGVVGLCWARVASDVVEAVVDVVYALAACRPGRGERWLMDMNVAYRVMTNLRPWLWRFEILIRRPRICPTSHPDTWCHYLVALLECGKKRAFDRVWNRFLRRGGGLDHFASYFRLAEAAVARGCRDPEFVRTVAVWTRLRKSREDNGLRRLVEGKTVAVVGNGPQELGKGLGDEIDAHDVVIRINNYDLAGHEADYGRRTDVWVKNTTPEMRHVKPSPEIKAIVYNGNWARDRLEFGYRERLAADLDDRSVFVDYIDGSDRQEVSEAIRSVPTSGGLILSALRKCACKSIDVYGCSYAFGGVGGASSYRRLPQDVSPERVAMLVEWHCFDREVAYLSGLINGRRL